jgi:hypothetical protein
MENEMEKGNTGCNRSVITWFDRAWYNKIKHCADYREDGNP